MKTNVDRAETRRVLADIADAVRPVERARTAAAVNRVLDGACANGPLSMPRGSHTPFRTYYLTGDPALNLLGPDEVLAEIYAPHVVSPHLFGDQS